MSELIVPREQLVAPTGRGLDPAARFFIVGCQRSGTTLLRLILEGHSSVFCFDELLSYSILQGRAPKYPSQKQLLGFKIPRWSEQLLAPVLLDEGPEGPCERFYRGEKLLFLVREPRDTVASMFGLRAATANWFEVWGYPILLRKFASAEFRDRYVKALDLAAMNVTEFQAGCAALYWTYKTEAILDYQSQGLPVLPVFYDELVQQPRLVLHRVCQHLGIGWDDALLHHDRQPHGEIFAHGLTVGKTDPKRPIYNSSIDRWKTELTQEAADAITEITGQVWADVQQFRLAAYAASYGP